MLSYLDFINDDIAGSIFLCIEIPNFDILLKYAPFKSALRNRYLFLEKIKIDYSWINTKFVDISKDFRSNSSLTNIILYKKIIENISKGKLIVNHISNIKIPLKIIDSINTLKLLESLKYVDLNMIVFKDVTSLSIYGGSRDMWELKIEISKKSYFTQISYSDLLNILLKMNI